MWLVVPSAAVNVGPLWSVAVNGGKWWWPAATSPAVSAGGHLHAPEICRRPRRSSTSSPKSVRSWNPSCRGSKTATICSWVMHKPYKNTSDTLLTAEANSCGSIPTVDSLPR